MKKQFFSITLLFVLVATSFAQTDYSCGTPSLTEEELQQQFFFGKNDLLLEKIRDLGFEVPDDYFSLPSDKQAEIAETAKLKQTSYARTGAVGSIVYIPAKVWVYTSDNGTRAADDAKVHRSINNINLYFKMNNVPIVVYLKCGISVISDTDHEYYKIDSNTELNDMWNERYDGNALNMHFINSGQFNSTSPWGGVGRLNSKLLAVTNNIDQAGFAHEVGHCLGLSHTHKARCDTDPNGDNGTCAQCTQECVSRTRMQNTACTWFSTAKNCEINGDCLCDTDAEPKLSNSSINFSTMVWSHPNIPTDAWGEAWTTKGDNIMSYAGSYRQKFTLSQIAIMVNEAQALGFTCSTPPNNHEITGNSTICPNETGTFNIAYNNGSNSVNYYWDIAKYKRGEAISYQSSSSSTWWSGFRILTTPLNSNTIIVQAPALPANAWLVATPINDCSKTPLYVRLDNNVSISINGPSSVVGDNQTIYTYQCVNCNNPVWTIPYTWTLLSGQNTNFLRVKIPENAWCGYVRATDRRINCGADAERYVEVSGSCGADCAELAASNPPASLNFDAKTNRLSIASKSEKQLTLHLTQVTDGVQQLVTTIEPLAQKEMDLNYLPVGVYVVDIPIPGTGCAYTFSFGVL